MRRDLIIGVVVSILIHGGVAWLGEVFRPGAQKHVAKEEAPTIQLMEMPKIEPDEPEKVESDEAPTQVVDFAPPMQTDVPQIVQLDSFVQQVQPPPPEGMKPNVGVITIPQGRPGGNSLKGMEIFDPSKLDQQPQPKVRVQPQYPFEMRRAGITGEVLVEFIVDSNGDVRNAFAVRSTQREFETAAVQAVSKWKFRPGKKGGRYVNTRMQQPISFSLSEE